MTRRRWRWETYERIVEWIENRRGSFTIAQAWYGVGRGVSAYTLTGHAVHDMARHRLLRCIDAATDVNGRRRCLRWEVTR